MKRIRGMMVLLAGLGGWSAMGTGLCLGQDSHVGYAPTVPGVVGPWGQPITMAAPYSSAPPGAMAAQAMMARNMPLDMVQPGAGLMPAGGSCPPGGCPTGGAMSPPGIPFAPPGMPGMPGAGGMPGMPGMPGMGGPGGFVPPPGAVAAVGALTAGVPSRFASQRTEVRFTSPANMKVSWYAPDPNGKPGFGSVQREVPGRYNFIQGAVYRLKLSDIPGRPNVELYPTLEIVPANAKTSPFLAHSAVPLSFTEEDFDQVAAGNFVVKVIYLPDPQFQDLATTGTDEVVSTRLEPGVDPIAEAYRRGSILAVIRLGNIDLELQNSPAMDAPNPYQARPAMPMAVPQGMGMGLGVPGPGPMVPYGFANSGKVMMMGPNGPMMMMGPNGPVPVNPGAPGMAPQGPGVTPPMGPGAGLPVPPGLPRLPQTNPGASSVPTTPPSATATDAPTARLPESSPVVPALYPLPPTNFTGQEQPASTAPSSANSSFLHRLWFGQKP